MYGTSYAPELEKWFATAVELKVDPRVQVMNERRVPSGFLDALITLAAEIVRNGF